MRDQRGGPCPQPRTTRIDRESSGGDAVAARAPSSSAGSGVARTVGESGVIGPEAREGAAFRRRNAGPDVGSAPLFRVERPVELGVERPFRFAPLSAVPAGGGVARVTALTTDTHRR